jgi:hypothetical protein
VAVRSHLALARLQRGHIAILARRRDGVYTHGLSIIHREDKATPPARAK